MWERAKNVTLISAIMVWIIFVIGGFIMAQETVSVGYFRTETSFSFTTMLVYWVIGFIFGSFLFGLAGIMDGQDNLAHLLINLQSGKKAEEASQKQLESTQQLIALVRTMKEDSTSDAESAPSSSSGGN